MVAAHRNDLRTDNRADNLKWATPSENRIDRFRNEPHLGPQKRKGLTQDQVAMIWIHLRTGGGVNEVARAWGLSTNTVSHINTGKTWGWLTRRLSTRTPQQRPRPNG